MRYAFIADIHANLAALTAVLEDIERRGGVSAIWCLGDIVGYGPEPRECLALLRQIAGVCVAGNHDRAAAGVVPIDEFNSDAAAAVHWAAGQLAPDDIDFLCGLPLVIEQGDFTLAHGSPREPIWEYVLSPEIARQNLDHFSTRYCLVGHSHRPAVFSCDGTCSVRHFSPHEPQQLGRSRMMINPGSVGQPRDGDPRAGYAIYDDELELVSLHRVPYDVRTTQRRMQAHGLPMRLLTRLSYGL